MPCMHALAQWGTHVQLGTRQVVLEASRGMDPLPPGGTVTP